MGAHLYAVPDPEPDEAPGPGDRPVLVPASVVRPRTAPDLRTSSATIPDETAGRDLGELDEGHVQDQDLTEEEEPGERDEEEAAPGRGYMTVPDLRPYVDPRPLAALGPLAVEAGKTAGPSLLRALGRTLRAAGLTITWCARGTAWYARGIGVLLVILAGWLSGKFGTGGIGARFAGAGFLLYAVLKLSTQYAYAPWITLLVLAVAAALAAGGHVEVPESKPAKKGAAKGEAKEKGAKEKGAEGAAKGKTTPAGKDTDGAAKGKTAPTGKGTEGAVEALPAVSKEAAPEAPRPSWAARLFRRPAPPAEAPPEAPAGSPDEAGEEAAEEAAGAEEETPVEAPRAPSREGVIEALHHLYGGGSGVLLTLLSEHLGTADTRALKEVLAGVSIPYRTGVRTPAGNGPGVHRDDIPPLPPPQHLTQGGDVVAGQAANANANNTANTTGEGLDAHPTQWTREQIERGFRAVPDPERGPSASRIERWPES